MLSIFQSFLLQMGIYFKNLKTICINKSISMILTEEKLKKDRFGFYIT